MRKHHVKPQSLYKNYMTYHLPVSRTICSFHLQPLDHEPGEDDCCESYVAEMLNYCDQVMPFDDIDLGQHWLRYLTTPTITRTKSDYPVVRIDGIYRSVASKRVLKWVPCMILLDDIFNFLPFLSKGQWVRSFVRMSRKNRTRSFEYWCMFSSAIGIRSTCSWRARASICKCSII